MPSFIIAQYKKGIQISSQNKSIKRIHLQLLQNYPIIIATLSVQPHGLFSNEVIYPKGS